MSKNSQLCGRRSRHSDFVIPSDFVIRHSDLSIEVCSIKRPVTGASGRGWIGSWRASFRFFACIGNRNPKCATCSFPREASCGSWRAPFRFFACIGTMNCPADVAQASSPASAPGVSPSVRAGGETPPQLAAGTAALRGSWRARTTSWPRIGTMNRLVLVLLLVFEAEPPNR